MGLSLQKILFGSSPSVETGRSVSVAPVVQPQTYKTASYASVPYERAPKVLDMVQTKNADGTPLLPGYVTPNKIWTC